MDLLVRSEPFYPLNYRGDMRKLTQNRAISAVLCSTYLRSRKAEEGIQSLLIKADGYLLAYHDDRYAHLAGLLDHLLALLEVSCHVDFRVVDVVGLEILLAHLAEMAGRGGVNGDVLIHRLSLMFVDYNALPVGKRIDEKHGEGNYHHNNHHGAYGAVIGRQLELVGLDDGQPQG